MCGSFLIWEAEGKRAAESLCFWAVELNVLLKKKKNPCILFKALYKKHGIVGLHWNPLDIGLNVSSPLN